MSDSFSVIPIFVAVVEQGGFSPAAKILGISKSAVSKRITTLEQHLGVKLLQRTTRKLSLTEAGEHYFEHAVKAHAAARDAEESATQLQGEPQGRLRINTPMSFGRMHIAPLLPEFLARYPKITMDTMMDDRQVDLVGGGFDLAIRAGDLPGSSLIARKLATLHSVVCASPAYLKKYGYPKTPSELSQHNCLLYTYSDNLNTWSFERDGHKQSVEVDGNYQVNNSEALREAILKGLGVGRLPTFVAGREIEAGTLINLFPDYQMHSKTIYAIFQERQYMPAKVRAFLDFVIEYLGKDEPYWDKQVKTSS